MTRFSGIKVLTLGIVLWAVAVWLLGAPHPAPTETPAATETSAAPGSAGRTAEPGAGAGESAGGEPPAASAPSVTASRTSATSPDPGTAVEGVSVRIGSADGTGAVPAPDPVMAGDGVPIAAAPAGSETTAPTASLFPAAPETAGTPAGPAAGSPPPPPVPGTAGVQEGMAGTPVMPPRPPHAWFEHPLSRPPVPPRSGNAAAEGNAVASQINAARRAAWEGRLPDALAHYQAAARIQPDLYVVWGEMGNVLWTMRRWSEAAYAFEGAATQLVRAGELRAANELVLAVESIDPDAAYRIQRLLWNALQRQSG